MADPLNQAIIWAGDNQAIVLAAGAGAVLLYLLMDKIDSRAFKDFKPKALKDRVIPDLKFRINNLGEEVDKDLKVGDFNKIGSIHKYLDMKLPENKKITIKEQSKEEKEKEVEYESVRAYLMTPQQSLKKILWYISDILLGRNSQTKILVAYKKPIQDEYDYHKIPETAEFKNKGGVLVQKGTATDNVINDIAKQDAEEGVWEGIPNFVEKINHMMPQHSQELEKLEAANEEDGGLM